MHKITPFLWFDGQAEEAANHYISIFDNSRILDATRYGPAAPMPEGTAMTVTFELDGLRLIALNGGPDYKFTEAVSLYVDCRTQDEVDHLWDKLSEGGEKGQCGWLKDRYGLSWQIVPAALSELLGDPDPEKSGRVMKAMLGMSKIEIKGLRDAHAGRA